jgi:predicted HAD superfamily hydrolase
MIDRSLELTGQIREFLDLKGMKYGFYKNENEGNSRSCKLGLSFSSLEAYGNILFCVFRTKLLWKTSWVWNRTFRAEFFKALLNGKVSIEGLSGVNLGVKDV